MSKMTNDLAFGEVLKTVFPLLDGKDLASCMCVSRQWRDVARDDYFWKCLCAKRWPSICKRPSLPMFSYHRLFTTFSRRDNNRRRTLLPPRLSFDDIEFYIDLWAEEKLLFSEVVPGNVLRTGIRTPPSGICDVLRVHLEGPDYKMTMSVDPRFTIPLTQTVTVSVFVGRKDTNKMACIINRSVFDYVDATAFRALAFDYLGISPIYPFVSGIRAWVSLLFMQDSNDGVIDVFGIEIDFADAATSQDEVLWLLDMLDWKKLQLFVYTLFNALTLAKPFSMATSVRSDPFWFVSLLLHLLIGGGSKVTSGLSFITFLGCYLMVKTQLLVSVFVDSGEMLPGTTTYWNICSKRCLSICKGHPLHDWLPQTVPDLVQRIQTQSGPKNGVTFFRSVAGNVL